MIIAGLNVHAHRLRDELRLNALEVHDTRAEIGAWLILGSVGTVSAAIALFTGFSRWFWPGWVYMVLPFVMPAYGARSARARRRLLARP